MAAAPGPIRAPGPASTRATRTARPRPCGHCSWRSKSGSRRARHHRRAVFPGSLTAPPSRPSMSWMPAVPDFAVAPGANQIVPPVDWVDPPARIDNVYGALVSASTPTATRSPASGCRRSPYRSAPIPAGTSTGRSPANSPTVTAPSSRSPGPRPARGGGRRAPLARGALRHPRGLCRQGRSRGRSPRRRASPIAGRRRRLCRGRREMRSVLSGDDWPAAMRSAQLSTSDDPLTPSLL